MSAEAAPQILFPCEDYPVKVIGECAEDFRDLVIGIMQRHAPELDVERVVVRDSRNGRYQSVHFVIKATGEDQLKAIHHDLRKTGRVQMVL